MSRLPLVAIMAAYNEADIIGATVSHLVEQGAFLYLLDDGSTDGTVEAARAAAGDRLIGWESLAGPADSHPRTFQWSRILDRKSELAASIDADWFIHQDADEFRESPWPHLTLAEAVSLVDRLGWNAIDFEVFTFVPEHGADDAAQDLAGRFKRYHPGAAYDRVQVRCWKKTPLPVDLKATGGHEARFPGRRIFPVRFLMRHYPIRSTEQGERKVFRERKPRFDPEELARGWHVQYEGLEPGRPLSPDDATALPYDADAARVALHVRNRLVEAAYPSVVPAPPADLATTVRRIDDARARQIEQLRNLTLALEESRRDLAALRASHAEVQARLEQALDRAATLEAALGDVRGELAKVNRDARDLTSRLDAVFQSRSWRVTKPLRAIWRMLGGE
jgi:hypothetical protein